MSGQPYQPKKFDQPKRFDQPRKPTYTPPSIFIRGLIPAKEINPEHIEQLFMIVMDGDYNKIKNAISEKNIALNVKNTNGQSLIHVVLENNSSGMKEVEKYELIKYLIDHEAPISAFDKNNVTALHLSAKYQYSKIVKLLLDSGANANVLDASNMTPLHYAVQGDITSCKKKKKVGSLIPKPIDKNITAIELKELTVKIIDIFQQTKDINFKQYFNHIKSTFDKINEIYPYDFEYKEKEILQDIIKITTDQNTTQVDKTIAIKKKITSFVEGLNNDVRNKLKDVLKPFDINIQNLDSSEISDILPKPTIDEQKRIIDVNFNSEKITLFNTINTLVNKIIKEFNITENTIYSKLHNIIMLNKALEANRVTDLKPEFWDSYETDPVVSSNINNYIHKPNGDFHIPFLDKLILNDSNKLFPFYEINIVNNIPNDPTFLDEFLPERDNNLYTAFRVNNKEFNDNKKQYQKLVPPVITDDRLLEFDFQTSNYNSPDITDPNYIPNPFVLQSLVGKQVGDILEYLAQTDGFSPIPVKWINDDQRIKQPNDGKGPFSNKPYYYVSKFMFSIKQIRKHQNILENNIKTLENHIIEHSYTYRAYQDIIPNLVLSIYNIFQNILLAYSEKNKIQSITLNIRRQYETNFNNNIKHPYSYLFGYSRLMCDELYDTIEIIYEILDKIYIQLYSLIDKLNDVVNLINKQSGITYIKSYITNPFTSNVITQYPDIYNRILKSINLPPKTREDYVKIFGKYEDKIDLMRELFYNQYCPFVDINKNYPTYLFRLTIKDKDKDNINPMKISNLNPKNNKYQIIQTDTKSGYLSTHYNDFTNEIQFNVYNKDKIKTPYDNLGHVGAVVFNESLDKSKPTISSIGNMLSTHLYNIKYWLIQNIIEKLKDEKQLIEKIGQLGWKQNPQIILYVTISNIANELIIEYIKKSIYNGINKYARSFATSNSGITITNTDNDIALLPSELTFGINFNELYDDIINKVIGGPSTNDFNLLMHTVNVMEDEEKLPDQFQIYNPNYTTMMEIIENQCYKINSDVIKELLDHGADVNKRDNTGAGPLNYAIDTLHKESINLLLSSKMINVSAPYGKNVSSQTPRQHALNMYSHHIGSLINNSSSVKEIINKFTEPIYKNIKESLEINVDFKNNVIKYLDIVFPQLIIMYNNLLYFYAKSYVNKWSYDDQTEIEQLLWSTGILSRTDNVKVPLLQDFDQNIIKNSVNLDALTKKLELDDKKTNTNKSKLDNLNNMIQSLNKEIDVISKGPLPLNKFTTNYINNLQLKISALQKQVGDIVGNNTDIIDNNKFYNSHISDISKQVHEKVITNMEKFTTNRNYLGKTSYIYDTIFNEVSKIYSDIFNNVIQSVNIKKQYTGYEDYFLYNRLWRSVINDSDKLKNVFNIQLLLALLEKKYIEKLEKNPSKNEVQTINHDLSLIGKLYNNVFIPTINNMYELPQYYDQTENYMLTESLDIIKHIIKQVFCSNLYYAVIKVITKYFVTLNTKDIPAKINIIKAELKKHILKDMPTQLVKIKTKIYENETEEQTGLKTDESLFLEIIDIITKNYSDIPKDSSLITNLTNYVFKYYKTLFDLVIPKMKVVIDNYSRFIVNEGRIIDIVVEINKKTII